MSELKRVAIAGNVIYVLWIVFNGIDSGFSGTRIEIVSYIGLITLLIINLVLLTAKRK